MTKSNLFVSAIAVAIVASMGHARADEWQFSVSPYIWAVSLDGEQTVKGNTTDIDASFIDIIEESDSIFALQAHFELNNGTWGVFFDPTYATLTFSGDAGPIDIDVDVDYVLVEFGATYLVTSWSNGEGRESTFEALAGVRYTSNDVKLDLKGQPFDRTNLKGQPFDRTISGDQDWIDPFVGGRVTFALSDGVKLRLRGDVGGFGVGSDFTYNVRSARSAGT